MTQPPPRHTAPVGSWDRAAILALGTAGCALSYDALQQMAVAIHVRGPLTYLFPLVIDGFIAYGVRALLLTRTARLRARLYVWALFAAATAASIWANALHAIRLNQTARTGTGLHLGDITVGVLSTLAPLALAGAVHLYILITRHLPQPAPTHRTTHADRQTAPVHTNRTAGPPDQPDGPDRADRSASVNLAGRTDPADQPTALVRPDRATGAADQPSGPKREKGAAPTDRPTSADHAARTDGPPATPARGPVRSGRTTVPNQPTTSTGKDSSGTPETLQQTSTPADRSTADRPTDSATHGRPDPHRNGPKSPQKLQGTTAQRPAIAPGSGNSARPADHTSGRRGPDRTAQTRGPADGPSAPGAPQRTAPEHSDIRSADRPTEAADQQTSATDQPTPSADRADWAADRSAQGADHTRGPASDEDAEIERLIAVARPAVQRAGRTNRVVVRSAMREHELQISNERMGIVLQRLRAEKATT